MKTKKTNDIERLRQKAEEFLTKHQSKSEFEILEYDNLKLSHELKVHQIELEIQIDKLLEENVKSELEEKK